MMVRAESRGARRSVNMDSIRTDRAYAGQRSATPAYIHCRPDGARPSSSAGLRFNHFGDPVVSEGNPMVFSAAYRPQLRVYAKKITEFGRQQVKPRQRKPILSPVGDVIKVVLPAGGRPGIEGMSARKHSTFVYRPESRHSVREARPLSKEHSVISARMRVGSDMSSLIAFPWDCPSSKR